MSRPMLAGERMRGRRALITGGASGLGAAIAELFAREGAAVLLADLPSARPAAEEVAARIEAAGGSAAFEPCDVRLEHEAERAVEACVRGFGGIDAVVASAAERAGVSAWIHRSA